LSPTKAATFAVVRALRTAGYDVLAICESASGSDDVDVLSTAVLAGRVLITEDRDFGQLAQAANPRIGGIIYIRFPGGSRASLPAAVLTVIEQLGPELPEVFVVLQPGRVRISRA
jgi:predicted nuclease of predicted toxin-antitoxin system